MIDLSSFPVDERPYYELAYLTDADPQKLLNKYYQKAQGNDEEALKAVTKDLANKHTELHLCERVSSLENFSEGDYFLDTLRLAKDFASINDHEIATSTGRYKKTLLNWRNRLSKPTWDERIVVLAFLAEQVNKLYHANIQAANPYEALKRIPDLVASGAAAKSANFELRRENAELKHQLAILQRGPENTQGGEHPTELAPGSSGE